MTDYSIENVCVVAQVELDQRTGSSLSNKDGELEGWDKEGENPSTPTYLASTNSYLYPETFTGIPLKIVRDFFTCSLMKCPCHTALKCSSDPLVFWSKWVITNSYITGLIKDNVVCITEWPPN